MENNNDKFIETLSSFLMTLKKDYSYTGFQDEVYNKIMFDSIQDIYNIPTIDLNKFDISVLKLYIKNSLNDYLKEKLLDITSGVEIINKYLDKNIKFTDSYKKNLEALQKLSNYFKRIDYYIPLSLCKELLKSNSKLNSVLKSIVDNNLKEITEENINQIFNDYTSISLIRAYCSNNNIKIKTNIDDEKFNEDFDKKGKLLTFSKEIELYLRIKKGDIKARNILVEKNLRLVYWVAEHYLNRGLSYNDLVQEGILGLIKAAEMFNPLKGARFATYAYEWINQNILRSLTTTSREIRLPDYVYYQYNKFMWTKRNLETKLGREPTLEEIAKEMNITLKKAQEISNYSQVTTSLNTPLSKTDEKSDEVSNFISSNYQNPEFEIEKQSLIDEVDKLLKNSNLTNQEKEILKLRFGFDERDPLTLEEIGKIYGISRERIRQLEQRAIKKLQFSKSIVGLADYMDCPKTALEYVKASKLGIKIERKSMKDESKVKTESKAIPLRRDGSNIYRYFSEYSEEEINKALEKLSEKQLAILHERYGENLKKPLLNYNITYQSKNTLYSNIFPRMKKILKENKEKEFLNNLKSKIADFLPPNDKPTSKTGLTKKDYKVILKIINMPEFIELTKKQPLLDCLVLLIKLLGYKTDKNLENEEIAQFLDVNVEEIAETSENNLLKDKEKINGIIDKTLHSKVYVNKKNNS